jgi:hypothetical protein
VVAGAALRKEERMTTIDQVLESIPMDVWLRMSPEQQARVMATHLGPLGAGRKLRAGKNGDRSVPLEPLTDSEFAALRASLPAYPPGEPAGWWAPEQLRAFIDAQDAHLAAAPTPAPQLDLDHLSDEQLHRVAACQSREQFEQVAKAILAEQGRS